MAGLYNLRPVGSSGPAAKSVLKVQRFILEADGSLKTPDGFSIAIDRVDDQKVSVTHLVPHVIRLELPRGDTIGIKIVYSSHCWSRRHDPTSDPGDVMLIMDGNAPRVFDIGRFANSRHLPDFLSGLASHHLYWTPSDRNYGLYNATTIVEGRAYTAFFTLRKDRGKIDGARHSLVMRVESAYHAPQPSKGMRVKAAAAIDAALRGTRLKFR
uniref:hypothetical protein n=1 Tax=Stappia sp. TaxID=1870903 RepID=UPI003BA948E0